MKLSDDEVIDRVRTTLTRWADEVPVPEHGRFATVGAPEPATPRRWPAALLGAAATLVLIIGGAILVDRRGDSKTLVTVGLGPSEITRISAGLRFGVRSVDVTDDAVWVTSVRDEMLYRIDPATNGIVASYPIPSHVEGVTAAFGSLWLSRYEPHEIIRLDPATGLATARLSFESQPALVAGPTDAWVVAERKGQLAAFRVDPATTTITDEVPIAGPPGFAALDGNDLWVTHFGTTNVSHVDLADRRLVAVVDVGGEPRDLVVAGGAIWVGVNGPAPEQAGRVVRIDRRQNQVTASVPVGRGYAALASGDGAVWANDGRDGTLTAIDATTAAVLATSPLASSPSGLGFGHGSLWLTPFRQTTVLRIDTRAPLEEAALPDIARTVEVSAGSVYVRCSGTGSPTVVLESDAAAGLGSWAFVQSRLSSRTRVCSYDRVGVADETQAGQAGPAATAARDLDAALHAVGEVGPFLVVGRGLGGYVAQIFASVHGDQVIGLVLVDAPGPSYLDQIREILPAEALARFEAGLADLPEFQGLGESAAQVAALAPPDDLPLVVLAGHPADAAVDAANSDPPLTVAEIEALDQFRQDMAAALASSSSRGHLIALTGPATDADIVDAVMSLLG